MVDQVQAVRHWDWVSRTHYVEEQGTNRRFRHSALPVGTLDEVTPLRFPVDNIADITVSKAEHEFV
jgi:hypothetical protein